MERTSTPTPVQAIGVRSDRIRRVKEFARLISEILNNSRHVLDRARKFPLDAAKTWRRTIVEDAHVQPSGLIWGGGLRGLREAKAVSTQ